MGIRNYLTVPETHHSLNNLLHFPDDQLQDQADSLFVLAVLLDDLLEQPLRFLAILALLDSSIARHTRVLFHRAQTNDLIPVSNQLINQPVQRKVGVIILVRATQKRPAPSGTLVSLMLVVEGQREICSVTVIKGIE